MEPTNKDNQTNLTPEQLAEIRAWSRQNPGAGEAIRDSLRRYFELTGQIPRKELQQRIEDRLDDDVMPNPVLQKGREQLARRRSRPAPAKPSSSPKQQDASPAPDLAAAHAHLTSARALIDLALQAAHDHLGTDLPDVVKVLDQEISDLAESLEHHHNNAIAERLGLGFNYDPS